MFARGNSPTFEELVGWLIHEKHHQGLRFNNKHEKETLFVCTQHPFKSNNDEHCKKTCNYYGQISHWLWNYHEKKTNIQKLETDKHTRSEASKFCQSTNIVEEESYYGEHGENEEQSTPIIELFEVAITSINMNKSDEN